MQGDVATVQIGEKVVAVFQLDFKKADVARLPDGDRFAELAFEMRIRASGLVHRTHEPGRISPHANPPFLNTSGFLFEEQVVRVVFSFTGGPFKVGDSVDLFCFFQSANFQPAPDGPVFLGAANLR